MWPIEFVYSINRTTFERVDEIKDFDGVIIDGRMSFFPHIEEIIEKAGFMKRISRDFLDLYTHKTLYTSLVRPNLELERVQHNFILYAVRQLPWRVWSLSAYDARCLLIGLKLLSDRRIVVNALSARDILVGRVD
jgi:hypothetical protein